MADGVTEGTIWLFSTDEVLSSVNDPKSPTPSPTALVRSSAAINGYTGDFIGRGNILFQLRWSDDSRYLYFIGRDGQENRQLFRADVQTGDHQSLSPGNQDVVTYRLAGKSVAYLAGPDVDANADWVSAGPGIPDIVVGTGKPLLPLLYLNFRGYAVTEQIEFEAWQVQGGAPEPIVYASSSEVVRVTSSLAEIGSSASSDGTHRLLTDELLANTKWKAARRARTKTKESVQLAVRESLNTPPTLVATDVETGRSRTIFDPNPQLSDIAMAEVRVYEWQDPHGRTIKGGLVIPPDFRAGERYPLVLQTHGFNEERVFRVGYSETANAGRALAGRGIVVLQVQEPWPDEEPRWANLARQSLDVYVSAVDALAEDGMIDLDKVGITGYSESGLFTAASLTQAPDRFAAALIANSDPLTITGYYSYVDSPLHGVTEQLLGTTPYGHGLPPWVERSPSMATDKIETPVMIFASDPWHLLSLWDFYAALRYQGKPVELLYTRTGRHNIKKPLHKLAHQEALVDWFDFWLNGNEYPGAEKREQYRRWRKLKDTVGAARSRSYDLAKDADRRL